MSFSFWEARINKMHVFLTSLELAQQRNVGVVTMTNLPSHRRVFQRDDCACMHFFSREAVESFETKVRVKEDLGMMFRYVGVVPLAVICWVSCIGRKVAHSFVIGGVPTAAATTTTTARSVLARMSASAATSTEDATTTIPVIQGIRDIVDDYDVFLLDMWYVPCT